MENFTLWNLTGDARRIRFFASSLGLQQINRGTREMLVEMMHDLGFKPVDIDDWAVSHLATDYLSDNRDSEDWEDRWMGTWSVEVHLKDAAALPERRRRTPTLASDETWEGKEPAPSAALVVADFKDDDSLKQMKAALDALGHSPAGLEGALPKAAPKVPSQLAKRISDEVKALHAGKKDAPPMSYESSQAAERQLLIRIPSTKSFFEHGAKLALLIEELAKKLGGSTYWRDTSAARSKKRD